MSRTQFFLTSLVAGIPAVLLVVILGMSAATHGFQGIMWGVFLFAALCGMVIAALPVAIMFYAPLTEGFSSGTADSGGGLDDEALAENGGGGEQSAGNENEELVAEDGYADEGEQLFDEDAIEDEFEDFDEDEFA